MKTESMGRITWFANSRAMLEPQFRGFEQSLWGTPTRESVHAKRTQPNGSTDPGHAPHSHFRDKGGETNPEVIVVPLDFSPASLDAVRVGASVARHTQATLVLWHAIFPRVIPFGPASKEHLTQSIRLSIHRHRSGMHYQQRTGRPFDDAPSRVPGEEIPGRSRALFVHNEQIEAGAVFDDNFGGKSLDNPCLRLGMLLCQRL
jgi:hypothetical protein